MSRVYDRQRQLTAARTAPAAAPAAPARIGNQSMEALTRGAQAPSPENMGHRVDLPGAIRAKMENTFGADFGGVRLYESQAVADAGANAVAMGSRIAFAPGKLDFSSSGGQALLGHELSHVTSQARGEVSGRGFLNDRALEARADREGALAAAGESVYTGPVTPLSNSSVTSAAGPMQASKGDKKRREQERRGEAAQIMQGVIRGSEGYGPAFNARLAQNTNTYTNYTQALTGIDEDTRGRAMVPYTNARGEDINIPYSEYQKRLEEDINGTPNVDLGGMSGKSMLKNAKGLQALANDFRGLDIRHIYGSDPSSAGGISKDAGMDACFGTRDIRINSKLYKPNMKVTKAKRKNGKFGFSIANDNYSLSHEAGHNVNYHLTNKLNKTARDNGKRVRAGDIGGNDWASMGEISKAIIADTLAKQASADGKLDALLRSQLRLRSDQALNDPAVLRQMVGAMDTGRRGYGSALLNKLHKKGYTSGYGTYTAKEFFAEAFADHYHNNIKDAKYSAQGEKGRKKLANLRGDRNYFSDALVQRARELFDDEEKRKEFLDQFI